MQLGTLADVVISDQRQKVHKALLSVVVAEQRRVQLANRRNVLGQPIVIREVVTKRRQDLRTFVEYFQPEIIQQHLYPSITNICIKKIEEDIFCRGEH
jgi:hypothetical protein